MIPLLSQIAEHCRVTFLGDTEISGGTAWTDDALLKQSPPGSGVGPLAGAYEFLIRKLSIGDHQALYRYAFYNLPAYTGLLDPLDAGFSGNPVNIWERSVGNVFTDISKVVPVDATSSTPSGVLITCGSAHPFLNNQNMVVFNVGGLSANVNDEWWVGVPDTTHVALHGALATGAYTAGTGVLSDSPELWNPMPITQARDIWETDSAANAMLSKWTFDGGVIRFSPASTTRQIRVNYKLSGSCPPDMTASAGIDGSMNFLSCYTAALCAQMRGTAQAAANLSTLAMVFLTDVLREDTKERQMERVVSRRFRPQRSTGPVIRY